MSIELNPVDDHWQAEWDRLMADPWLRRKLDRDRRLTEHQEYQYRWVPGLSNMDPGLVIDLGPGAGETLEIARSYGHDIVGIDAPSGDGGMGGKYLRASKLMHERQRIPMCYVRAFDWLGVYTGKGRAALINSRGSIEQILSDCLDGPPHHEHQDCHKLTWRQSPDTVEKFGQFFERCHSLLRPGGMLLIAANGTGTAESDRFYCRTITEQATAAGLTLTYGSDIPPMVHRWTK